MCCTKNSYPVSSRFRVQVFFTLIRSGEATIEGEGFFFCRGWDSKSLPPQNDVAMLISTIPCVEASWIWIFP